MAIYDIYGNTVVDATNQTYTHTVVRTHEVEGGTTETVDVTGCITGSLCLRNGGSYMPYKVYDCENNVISSGTSWGSSHTYPESDGAAKVEVKPTDRVTVVWLVQKDTPNFLPDEYREGRVLVFHDEFSDRKLDLTKWYEEKAYNRRGSERGDGTNAFVHGDNLHLRILREHQYLENHTIREWSGEVLHSLFQYKYGLAEAKIRFASKGAWMSFWALGANVDEYPKEGYNGGVPWTTCGEIDFVECAGGSSISGNIHWDSGAGNDDDQTNIYQTSISDLTTNYHVFSCEWTEETITWYVDYHKYGSVSVDDYKNSDEYNAFRLPMHLLFSSQPILTGNGVPDEASNMLDGCVEWVRVYAPEGWTHNEPTGLLIDGNDGSEIFEFKVGDTHDWAVTISPEQTVDQTTIWSSSQPHVASVCVNGGHLECLTDGYTTITAKMWNGVQTSVVVHVSSAEAT